MLFDALIYAGLVPLVTSATVAFIMRRSYPPMQTVWPIAITAGFLAAHFALHADVGFAASVRTFFEPHEAIDWLPHIVLLALAVSILVYAAPSQRGWFYVLAVALCVAAPVRLLSGNVASQWSFLGKLAWLGVLTTMLVATWIALSTNDESHATPIRVPLLVLLVVGIAVVLTKSGVFIYGESAAALAAAVSGVAIAIGWRTKSRNSGVAASAGVIALAVGSLIILTQFFAELSLLNASLLLVALIATALPLPAFVGAGAAWRQVAVRAALCVAPMLLVLLLVIG
jgi:hypothetical protein